MADQGMAAPYVPRRPDEEEAIGVRAAPLNHVQRRFLHAGRILVAGGWLVLITTCATDDGNRAANAEHALLGFALFIFGVFLVVMSPVTDRFPGAARAGAAVADAVIVYFFAPAAN